MQILKYTDSPTAGVQKLSERLSTALTEGKRVLWFLTGGSGIHLCVQVMDTIGDEQSKNLTLALGDERFGPPGHKDSNWQQLNDAGFDPKSARTVSVLQADLKDMYEAAKQYGIVLQDVFAENDVIVGQYGMGPDGHMAGIKPGSPAVNADGLVTAYQWDDYQRITTTFEAIKRCDVAFLFAEGEAKRPMLENLQRDLPLDEQPAQILKQLPEAYVYNDQIGENE